MEYLVGFEFDLQRQAAPTWPAAGVYELGDGGTVGNGVNEEDPAAYDAGKQYVIVTEDDNSVKTIKVVQGFADATHVSIKEANAVAATLKPAIAAAKFTFDGNLTVQATDVISNAEIISTNTLSVFTSKNDATKLTINGVAYTIATGTTASFVPNSDAAKGALKIYGLVDEKTLSFTFPAGETTVAVGSTADGAKSFTVGAGTAVAFLMVGTTPAVTTATGLSIASEVTVAKDATDKSTLQATTDTDSSVEVAVAAGTGKYTISGMNNGDVVKIDGTSYTYQDGQFTAEGAGYVVKTAGTIAFTAKDGADTVDGGTAITYVGNLSADALKDILAKIGDSDTAYFTAAGVQQAANDAETTAYSFAKDSSTLTSTDKAESDITLDASSATGLVFALTAGTGVDSIEIDDTTTINASTLGAGDKIINSEGALVTAGTVAGATFTVAAGQEITLTSGTFASVAAGTDIKIAATGTNAVALTDVFSVAGTSGATATYNSENGLVVKKAGDGQTVAVTATKGTTANLKITGSADGSTAKDVVTAKSDEATAVVDASGDLKLTAGTFEAAASAALDVETATTGSATVKVDDVTFTGTESAAAEGTYVASDGAASNATKPKATLTSTTGTVSTDKAGVELLVTGGDTYTSGANGATIAYSGTTNVAKLSAGSVELDSTDTNKVLAVGDKGFIKQAGDETLTVASDGVVSWDTTKKSGISFTTADTVSADAAATTTYTVLNGNLIVSKGTDVKAYSTWTSVTMKTGEESFDGEVVKGTKAAATNIVVKPTETTTASTHYYSADGIELPSATGKAVTVIYTGTGASATAAVSVENVTVNAKIDMTGVKTTSGVTDTNGKGTYLIGTSEFTGNGFETAVSGDNTTITGAVTALTANGTYYLGAAADTTTVTFATGTAPDGAKVVLSDGTEVSVTESANTPNATVIKGGGSVEGLDIGAQVTAAGITATTAENADLSLKVTNTGIATVDTTNYITFTAGSSGSFTFTGNDSATALKGVTATITGKATVVGAKGETESLAVTAGGTVKADANGDLTITAAGTYTTVEKGEIAVDAAANVIVNTTGSVNAVTFVKGGAKVTGTYTGSTTAAKVKAELTSTDAADGLTAATASVALKVHGTEYTVKDDDSTTILYGTDSAVLTDGSVELDLGESIAVKTGGTKLLGSITNNSNKKIGVGEDGKVYVYDDSTKTWTENLTGGVSFTTKDDTYTVKYTVSSDKSKITVEQTAGTATTTRTYDVSGNINIKLDGDYGAYDPSDDGLKEVTSGIASKGYKTVDLASISSITDTKYFNAAGVDISSTPTAVADAAVVVNGGTTPKTVTVNSAVEASAPIDLTGTSTRVTDKTGTTLFNLNDSRLSGSSFSVDSNVITDTGSNGVSVTTGSVTLSDADGVVDISSSGGSATFTETTQVSGAKVTTAGGQISITESGTGKATVVDKDGNVSGLDGNVTVSGAALNGKTVTTTGDGTTTINGVSYTVKDDGNGVVYTAADKGASAFSDLKAGATITMNGAFSGGSITDSDLSLSVTNVTSVDGVSFTKSTDGTGYTGTLDKTGESVTFTSATGSTTTVTANTLSGSGITMSSTGVISGISNGDKLTVASNVGGAQNYTYEVKDGILVITDAAAGTTTTYKQVDSSTPFQMNVSTSWTTPVAGTYLNDVTEQANTTGFQVGSDGAAAGAVTSVTNGMLVDKQGHATTDESKATAKLTIADSGDAVVYESKTDTAQTVVVGAGTAAANMEWAVTTGKGADRISVATSKDSIIDAGDGKNTVALGGSGDSTVRTGTGNDTITLNSTGSTYVEVAGGNNTLTNNNTTGTATLKGGSGNDTFKSFNEDDTIIFGDGSNKLEMTTNTTNTISDYEYGKDKLQTATTTGTLALDNINVGVNGTIGYGATAGAEGTAKVGADGQSVYAATITDANGKNARNVGWTGADGGMINATGQTERVVLIGNAEGAHDTLMGGQAGDTLKAGAGASSLWGGAGNDVIISSSTDSNEIFFLAGDGKDTVQGFTAYTEAAAETADVLDFYGQGATDIKMTADGLKIYNGESSMLVSGTYNADTMFRWKGNTGDEVRVAKIGYQDTANTMSYEDAATDYIGGRGIDTINATGGEVNLWMDGSQGKSFGNIEVINAAGNTENVTIAGGEGKNTLVGGTGDASLWGGVGSADDVLVGNGQTDFFYNMGGGNDSIAGHSGDTVDLFDMQLSDFNGIELDTANRRVILSTTAGHNVTISGGVDTFKVGGQTWTTSYASGSDWTLKE